MSLSPVPPPAARLLGRAAGVPRPVCPGCCRCGRGDPAPAQQRAPLRAGVAHCRGGGKASSGGCFYRCEELLRPGAPPLLTARPPGGLSGSVTHMLWARLCGCGGPALSPWPASAVGAAYCGGGGGPSPGGTACQRCDGRLVSGSDPPPAARPLGWAVGVPRPVCPGCGRCGRGDPAPAPQRAPLRAGVAHCRGGGKASSGGCFYRCEELLRPGAPPLLTARPPGGLSGSVTHMLWARLCGCGGPALSPWPASAVGAAYCGGGGGPSPGGTACQRCDGRLVSGSDPPPAARPLGWAVGVPRPVCPGCGRCGRGDPAPAPQRAPLRAGVAHCRGGGKASSGGCFYRREGRLRPGAPPLLTARPPGGLSGSVTHMLWARLCGCGGPALSPWPASAVGAAYCGGGGGPSPGGTACQRCDGHLVPGSVPPPVAHLLGRAAGVPRPVCPGCCRCGRGDPAPAPQRAPLQAGVAHCRGGGKASSGGCFYRCEGRLRPVAPPLLTARPPGGLSGSVTHMLWARLCGCGGPALSPWPASAVGAAYCGGGGGPSPGGTACQRCDGRLVSGSVPPPAARPLG